MYGGKGDSEESSDLRLLCLLVHALIHSITWCHNSLQFVLKFQAPVLEMVNLKEMTASSPSGGLLKRTGS